MKYIVQICFVMLLLLSFGARAEFVFADIKDPVSPIKRASKYEKPLDSFLRAKGLGEVTGGGTSMSRNGDIDSVGVDIELHSLKDVPLVAEKLRELGAPAGSILLYKTSGKQVKYNIR